MDIVYFALLLVATKILLAGGFEMTMRKQEDATLAVGWKFSKSRPFHYFDSIKDIDDSFLPVDVKLLPEGEGLWILRYKDFLGLPNTFESHKELKPFIDYTPHAQTFDKISIKAVAYGDVQVEFLSPYNPIGDVSIIGNPACVNFTKPTRDAVLNWTMYEYEGEPIHNLYLQISIPHPNSFLMIDEIGVTSTHRDTKKVTEDLGNDLHRVTIEGQQGQMNATLTCRHA